MKTKEYRTFKLEIRELDESNGHISGYASVFDIAFPVWDHMEVVSKGAFKRTLKNNQGKVPVLFNHYSMEWIGNASSGKEDDYGLYVTADLMVDKVQRAREIFALASDAMSKGMKVGLSIGFETMSDKWAMVDKINTRTLREINLWEWSITQWPANPDAQITDIRTQLRSLDDLANTVKSLTNSERQKLMALLDPSNDTLGPAGNAASSDIHDAEVLDNFIKACRGN